MYLVNIHRNSAPTPLFVTRFAFLLTMSAAVMGCSKAVPDDGAHRTQGEGKVQATTIFVHDPLLSIPMPQRDHYEASDSFLRSGRSLANYIRKAYPSKVVHIVH